MPTSQFTQADASLELEKVPASQPLQTPGTVEYRPAPQLRHTVEPVITENLPTAHVAQETEEFAPKALRNLPASHCTHREDAVAPITLEYVPALQGLQSEFEVIPYPD